MIQAFFPQSYGWITSSSDSTSIFSGTHIFSSIVNNCHDVGRYILNDLLFPDHVAKQCPESDIVIIDLYKCTGDDDDDDVCDVVSNVRIRIRQPCLAICAAFGVWVGYRAVVDLSSSIPHQTSTRPRREMILWMVAFGAFGLMNVSALPLHCLLDGPTERSAPSASLSPTSTESLKTYPDETPLLWMIDTYMTGLSSVCLYLASIDHITSTFPMTPLLGPSSRTKTPSTSSPVHYLATRLLNVPIASTEFICQFVQCHFNLFWKFGWFLHGVGLACMISFVMSSSSLPSALSPASKEEQMQSQQHQHNSSVLSSLSSVGLELWYLFTPPIAAVPIVCMILDHHRRRNCFPPRTFWDIRNNGRSVFCIGAFIGLTGVIFDRMLCETFGTSFWDLFGASTSVFLGCDCCFLGIYMIVSKEKQQPTQISEKATWIRTMLFLKMKLQYGQRITVQEVGNLILIQNRRRRDQTYLHARKTGQAVDRGWI